MTVATCNGPESPLETELASGILAAYIHTKNDPLPFAGREDRQNVKQTATVDARFLAGHTFANLVALLAPDETTDW